MTSQTDRSYAAIRADFPDVYFVPGMGFCGPQWPFAEAARYGNLSRVAITFYLSTDNPAELDAARIYARLAAHAAMEGGR